jgi:ATP-dependent Clp protease ATP-binding subunit ClpA
MGYSVSIPFHAVQLRFATGDTLWFPLQDKHALRLNTGLQQLQESYAAALQKHLLGPGQLQDSLLEFPNGAYQQGQLTVSFQPAEDGFTHPAFDLVLDYLYLLSDDGQYWGIVPALGVEALAPAHSELHQSLQEVIHMDFSRQGRLSHLQKLVSLMWFEAPELLESAYTNQFPTPKEIEKKPLQAGASWLGKVATAVEMPKPSAYRREEELKQLARTLKSPYLKNVALIGPHGVGKTALVWELVHRKQKLGIPETIWETTASVMIKELMTDIGWQENLSQLCSELHEQRAILFVRNLYELFEVGKYEGNTVSMGDYLQPYISRGEITLIGECTPEERSRIDLNNPGFLAQFQLLQLEEPTTYLEEIILKKVGDIAADQKVDLPPDAIQELIRLNRRFTPYAGLPGKPIRFMESLLLHKRSQPGAGKAVKLDRSEIISHFCQETGMPSFMVDPAIPVDLDAVQRQFSENVYGQKPAVDSLINVLASVKTGMSRTGKPIASFLFAGPTGVGKTELVKVLAGFMFGSRERLTRFDMSEYSTLYAAMGLIGMEPGSEGTLINAVRREPFSVVLFDEIEKAHSSFLDALLQILGEGRLTNARGQSANFCSTIIILTSNLGAENLQLHKIGWKKELEVDTVRDHFLQAVRRHLRPELFNRIDQIIPFLPLSAETMRRVVDREIQLLLRREGIAGRKMSLEIGEGVLDLLAKKGFDPAFGARYLQRTIQEQVAIPLACLLNQWDALEHVLITLRKDGEQLRLDAGTDPLSMDLLIEELEKFNLANLSSDKRKEVQKLEEGAVFLRLINELDILERQKEAQPKQFWNQPQKTKLYEQYQHIRKRFKAIRKEIFELETEIATACMGFSPYQPILAQKVDEWKSAWEAFREDLFLQLFPGDACWISVYGKSLHPILKVYYNIIKHKEFSIDGGAIWLLPQNEISVHSAADPLLLVPSATKREWLQLAPWKQDTDWNANLSADNSKGELYGVHWHISGPGAYWFFKDETGMQKWQAPEGSQENHLYAVKVHTRQPKIPENLHRKEFYHNKPLRRTFSGNGLHDSLYKVRHNGPDAAPDWSEKLIEVLEERFRRRIDEALY